MSIHYHKPNYNCPRCQSLFLPYKIGIQCPNCDRKVENVEANEYLDVIDQIAGSMKVHKMEHGRYFPGAWYTGNFMDHVQGIVYQVFDSMEAEKPENDEQYIMKILDNKNNWQENQYLSGHVKDIASEIFKIYKDKKFSEIKMVEHPSDAPVKKGKIRQWLGKFLP